MDRAAIPVLEWTGESRPFLWEMDAKSLELLLTSRPKGSLTSVVQIHPRSWSLAHANEKRPWQLHLRRLDLRWRKSSSSDLKEVFQDSRTQNFVKYKPTDMKNYVPYEYGE